MADSQVQLDHQAMFDPITDMLNRNGFKRSIPSVLGGAQRSGDSILVWFVDVRGLKEANDRNGHDFGDAVILAVTRALMSSVRANDLVVRWGGDEFVVVGEGAQGSAEELDHRVNALLERDSDFDDGWHPEVTVGFAAGPPEGGIDSLISAADTDMYRRRSAD